ncbi:hypothetical protein J3E72DRAFT_275061 [Bipolaris maydis]|nr:hypothetical protein J3E72DRAFT_275061 [Bipolaris maydis]
MGYGAILSLSALPLHFFVLSYVYTLSYTTVYYLVRPPARSVSRRVGWLVTCDCDDSDDGDCGGGIMRGTRIYLVTNSLKKQMLYTFYGYGAV